MNKSIDRLASWIVAIVYGIIIFYLCKWIDKKPSLFELLAFVIIYAEVLRDKNVPD